MSNQDDYKTTELPRPAHAVDDDAPTRTLPATMADFEVHDDYASTDAEATQLIEPRAAGTRGAQADGEATTVLSLADGSAVDGGLGETTAMMPVQDGPIDAPTETLPATPGPEDEPTQAMPVVSGPDDESTQAMPAVDEDVTRPVAVDAVPMGVAMVDAGQSDGKAGSSADDARDADDVDTGDDDAAEDADVADHADAAEDAENAGDAEETGQSETPADQPAAAPPHPSSIFPESVLAQPIFATAVPSSPDPAPKPVSGAAPASPSPAVSKSQREIPYLTRTLPTQGGVPLYSAQPPAGSANDPNVHQVPRETVPDEEPPAIRKTGPSAATITFGAILLLIGGLAMAFAVQFPWWAPQFAYDWRVAIALGCGALGAVLIVVAIVWSVIGLLRKK